MKSNIKYLDTKIKQELKDSEEYLEKAIEHKDMGKTSEAQMFFNMSVQELGHAEGLMKMQEDNVNKWDAEHPDKTGDSNIYREMWKEYYAETEEHYNKLKEKISKMK